MRLKVPKLPVVTNKAETLQSWFVRREHVSMWRAGLQEESSYGGDAESFYANAQLYKNLALGMSKLFDGLPEYKEVDKRIGEIVAQEFREGFSRTYE